MSEGLIKKLVKVERQTWIKGRISTKCKSRLSLARLFGSSRSVYRNESNFNTALNVSNTTNEIKENQEKWCTEFDSSQIRVSLKLTEPITVTTSEVDESYSLSLDDIRFVEPPKVSKVVKHGTVSYSTIEGEVIGYVLDHVMEEQWVPIVPPTNKVDTSPIKRRGNTEQDLAPGCFDFVRGVLTIIFILFFISLVALTGGIGAIAVLGLAFIMYWLLESSAQFVSFFEKFFGSIKLIFGLLFFVLFIYQIISHSDEKPFEYKLNDRESTTEEIVPLDKYGIKDGKDTLVQHHREWKDYDGNNYSIDLKIFRKSVRNVQIARKMRYEKMPYYPFDVVYDSLTVDRESSNDIGFRLIYEELEKIKDTRGLDSVEFAEMIVSMVQDIPYVLILRDECDWSIYDDDFIRKYLQDNRPCEPFVLQGVYSPEEFMYTLKGDCDTRTVLVYKILNHYGYDVRILNSDKYRHSIIAVNLRGLSGKHFIYDDKLYFTWETTSTGHRPGEYHPDLKIQSDWKSIIN